MKLKVLLLGLVLLCGIVGIKDEIAELPHYQNQSLVNPTDVDTILLSEGMAATKGWPDTAKHWRGSWTMGDKYKFYRPLTSMFFYAEWRAWGGNGLAQFQTVLLVLHLAVIALLLLFLSDMLGPRIAAMAVGIFALNLPGLLGLPIAGFATEVWKDQPEMLVTLPYIASLWCLLRYCRTDRAGWLIGAFVAFLVSILTKEMAYSLPFMAVPLLWHEGKLKSHWRVPLALLGMAFVLFAFRHWALQGMGFKFGTNGSWMARLLTNAVGGSMAGILLRGDTLPLAVVCAGIVVWLASRRRWMLAGATGAAVVLLYFVATMTAAGFEDSILLRLMMGELWIKAAMTALLVWVAYRAVTARNKSQLFGWLWMLIAYLPLATAPITQHALYLPAIGWGIFFAYSAKDALSLVGTLPKTQKNRKKLPLVEAGGLAEGV